MQHFPWQKCLSLRQLRKIFLAFVIVIAVLEVRKTISLQALSFSWKKGFGSCGFTSDEAPMDATVFIQDTAFRYQIINRTDSDDSIRTGGYYHPSACGHGIAANSASVAIVVPYRDRLKNLRVFLAYMHPYLQRQNLEYKIYMISQAFDGLLFNRGKLINIGFEIAMRDKSWDCVVFHDVDLLPQISKNVYECWDQPRHMNVASAKFDYKLPYYFYMGGVGALTPEQFRRVNGYSNSYFGWGGEDDDFSLRINKTGMIIKRSGHKIGRYLALGHDDQAINSARHEQLLDGENSFDSDGLNSLYYKVLEKTEEHLYTNVTVWIS